MTSTTVSPIEKRTASSSCNVLREGRAFYLPMVTRALSGISGFVE
jgi:hypothetical protein